MDLEYNKWLEDPTPDNLYGVVEAAAPVITSEIHKYPGTKTHLRSQAKVLTSRAIKSYDPTKGAALRSWVVTQLRPLSRYSHQLKPVAVSEVMARQSAELHNRQKELEQRLGRQANDIELADHIGISTAKIGKIRKYAITAVNEGDIESQMIDDTETSFDPAVDVINPHDFAAEAVYEGLDPRSKAIYDLKTGSHGKAAISNQQIAARFGISPALVTQITGDITQRIRKAADYGI